ncbi:hypothetical protein AZ22_4672 [Bordetella bronchiseptica 980-2]|nr:hypothetical protein AZ22_4672 [Bordetella bronchiseptica 980-2]
MRHVGRKKEPGEAGILAPGARRQVLFSARCCAQRAQRRGCATRTP